MKRSLPILLVLVLAATLVTCTRVVDLAPGSDGGEPASDGGLHELDAGFVELPADAAPAGAG
jgi:hypothetical protein